MSLDEGVSFMSAVFGVLVNLPLASVFGTRSNCFPVHTGFLKFPRGGMFVSKRPRSSKLKTVLCRKRAGDSVGACLGLGELKRAKKCTLYSYNQWMPIPIISHLACSIISIFWVSSEVMFDKSVDSFMNYYIYIYIVSKERIVELHCAGLRHW